MHIKKLEISGFKSFVDRTVVHFDHDVIGIVGPNGCGKSNIVDAIRWCMGEQSAKHLRGKRMEDVIFNGSESRGPHGLAEVTLTFDNSDLEQAASLPLEYRDYPEIAVTRRLYPRRRQRVPASTRPQVRLKDMTELFLGTGVGTKAYSHRRAGQDRAHRVGASRRTGACSSRRRPASPSTRAAKKQAERKMELTRAEPAARRRHRRARSSATLASLKRQAAKAERYVSYRNELEDLVLHEASHQLLEIVGLREVLDGRDASRPKLRCRRARTELDAREAELELERGPGASARRPRRAGAERGLLGRQRGSRTRSRDRAREGQARAPLEPLRCAPALEQVDLRDARPRLSRPSAPRSRPHCRRSKPKKRGEAEVASRSTRDSKRCAPKSAPPTQRWSSFARRASQAASQVAAAEGQALAGSSGEPRR